MKSNLGIVIYSNDRETIWNAFRLANFSLTQKDTVKVFLLGGGVGAKYLFTGYDTKEQMETFVAAGGQILACETSLKIRWEKSSAPYSISSMAELYEIIKEADKIITF